MNTILIIFREQNQDISISFTSCAAIKYLYYTYSDIIRSHRHKTDFNFKPILCLSLAAQKAQKQERPSLGLTETYMEKKFSSTIPQSSADNHFYSEQGTYC